MNLVQALAHIHRLTSYFITAPDWRRDAEAAREFASEQLASLSKDDDEIVQFINIANEPGNDDAVSSPIKLARLIAARLELARDIRHATLRECAEIARRAPGQDWTDTHSPSARNEAPFHRGDD